MSLRKTQLKLGLFYKLRQVYVFKVIKEINISKSSGLENISSFIVKESFMNLVPEVTHMFNLSVATSTDPDEWKKALAVPIPQTGNLKQVKNYRPISLLPLPGKVLEKLIHTKLSGYLEEGGLLNSVQHGFRKKHSTIHSVALTSYIDTKMDSSMPTLAAFINFRKAFDCVQHSKLASLNLSKTVLSWIKSYPTSSKQRVLTNSTHSAFLNITQGVPQGSVLGPLFYIILTPRCWNY